MSDRCKQDIYLAMFESKFWLFINSLILISDRRLTENVVFFESTYTFSFFASL